VPRPAPSLHDAVAPAAHIPGRPSLMGFATVVLQHTRMGPVRRGPSAKRKSKNKKPGFLHRDPGLEILESEGGGYALPSPGTKPFIVAIVRVANDGDSEP